MNFRSRRFSTASGLFFALIINLFVTGCQMQQPAANQQATTANTETTNTAPAQPVITPDVAADNRNAEYLPVTMPVLDAMFSDENFAQELKSRLGLTDEQVERLRQTAREATGNLDESGSDEMVGSTNAAKQHASEQIRAILGDEKAEQLNRLITERWSGGAEGNTMAASSGQPVNSIPGDTRIVVNAPAYRMDLFKDGRLVRTYKIGIGYPEFPLPTGMRKADTIIFNPTWTPPDEPWVKGKIKPGQKVEAGSKLNPLGPIKIPIGLPSLIHGGKAAARLGGFASHGCVGLTNPQVQDFSVALAQLTGTELTEADVANYEKNKTETKNVKLSNSIPVELRYETIVVEDGKLKIYRDVYERGTNTEENLRSVLQAHGVSFDSLSEQERTKALDALTQMARDAQGNPADPLTAPAANANNSNAAGNNNKNTSQNKNANENVKETRTIKGAKEVTIEIAALQGKGYPAPVDLNTGEKSKRPLNLDGTSAGSNQTNGNTNQAASSNRNPAVSNSATKRF